MKNKDLLQRVRRINALNKKCYEHIQTHGYHNLDMEYDSTKLMSVFEENLIRSFAGGDIRLNIDYKIENTEDELYHLTLIVHAGSEIESIWYYFYSRQHERIVCRVEEINKVDEKFYTKDFCYNKTIEDKLLGAILSYQIGTQCLFSWKASNFIPTNLLTKEDLDERFYSE